MKSIYSCCQNLSKLKNSLNPKLLRREGRNTLVSYTSYITVRYTGQSLPAHMLNWIMHKIGPAKMPSPAPALNSSYRGRANGNRNVEVARTERTVVEYKIRSVGLGRVQIFNRVCNIRIDSNIGQEGRRTHSSLPFHFFLWFVSLCPLGHACPSYHDGTEAV